MCRWLPVLDHQRPRFQFVQEGKPGVPSRRNPHRRNSGARVMSREAIRVSHGLEGLCRIGNRRPAGRQFHVRCRSERANIAHKCASPTLGADTCLATGPPTKFADTPEMPRAHFRVICERAHLSAFMKMLHPQRVEPALYDDRILMGCGSSRSALKVQGDVNIHGPSQVSLSHAC